METQDPAPKGKMIFISGSTWRKMARAYRCFPFLKYTVLTRIGIILSMLSLMLLLNLRTGKCTCADQLPDQQLEAKAIKGGKAVLAYMQIRDDSTICEARRAELLKELERKKHVKPDSVKIN